MKKLLISISFVFLFFSNFAQQLGTFNDRRDDKVYKTVKIGTQTWFAENLAHKKFSGCWAFNDDNNNVAKYGYLYDQDAAEEACPSGWHLPSDAEWTILITFLGGEKNAGVKMKATTTWEFDKDGKATNQSGFNALAAGCRAGDHDYVPVGLTTWFWSSTRSDDPTMLKHIDMFSHAKSINLLYGDSTIFRAGITRSTGMSVRCIKD